MRLIARIFLLLFISFLPGKGFGQLPQELETLITQFRFQEAESLLNRLDDPALQSYYLSHIHFLKNISTDDPVYEDAFFSACENALDEMDKLPATDGRKMALEAEIHFQRGAIKFSKKNYLSAAGDLKKACNLVQKNQETFPDHPAHLRLLGTFHLVLSAVPGKLQWLSNLLCFQGDMEYGKWLLETASKGDAAFATEADIVLFFYEKNFISDSEASLCRIQSISQAHSESPILQLLTASSLIENGKNEEAIALLEKGKKWRDDPDIFFSPIWDLYLARSYFYRLDYTKSIRTFEIFLREYNGEAFKNDVQFRLGVANELSGKREEAKKIFVNIVEESGSGFDADMYAKEMALVFSKRPMTPTERVLFEARLRFDGGYFGKSYDMLLPMLDHPEFLNENDKAELFYRTGRNLNAMNQTDVAAEYYTLCIQSAPDRNLWMKVYASYYLGQLKMAKGLQDEAILLFKSALDFDDYHYQSGLERRCKSALSEARKKANNQHAEN